MPTTSITTTRSRCLLLAVALVGITTSPVVYCVRTILCGLPHNAENVTQIMNCAILNTTSQFPTDAPFRWAWLSARMLAWEPLVVPALCSTQASK
jgi:hypothetical protein